MNVQEVGTVGNWALAIPDRTLRRIVGNDKRGFERLRLDAATMPGRSFAVIDRVRFLFISDAENFVIVAVARSLRLVADGRSCGLSRAG